MIGEPKMDMGGPKTPEEEKEMTPEERAMLWDDAMHYLDVLKNKVKGMRESVVSQKELPGGMSIEYYLEDIETDAASMASLFEDLKKNKFPKLEE